jgi:tetratricopeptide (TPR) repeat protein
MQTGQIDTAANVFGDLNNKYSKSVPIKINYANILATKGDFAKVQPIVDQLAKKNGSNPQVQVLKSALLLKAGKVNEAFDLLQGGVKNAPENLQLQMALGKVAQLKGDLNTAGTAYRTAEKLAPRDIEVQAALGEIASQRQDWSMLLDAADKTIALRPDIAQSYLWRGMAEASMKQLDKAETDFQTAVTKDPNNAAAYTGLGQLRAGQGHMPEALAMLEKALEKNPNEFVALNDIAGIDVYTKQPDKAIARIEQQIAKSPKNPAFYTLLGSVQLSTGDFNDARDNGKKAMELDPTNFRAVQVYTQAVASMGNVDEAIRTWEAWASGHPKDPDATSMLALLSQQKGDNAKAVEYYKKSLDIANGQGPSANVSQGLAANNLAYLMVTSGQNVDMALSYAQTARRNLPNSPDTADTLAWVYYYKGTYLSARDLLEGALKQSPDNASMHYHLGMTYSKLGRKADAQTQLKKAISLDPNSQTAKDAEAALGRLG